MDRRTFLKSTATSAAAVAAGGIFAPHVARAQQETITFGGSVPMSGGAAETGLNVMRGYECAVKYINEEMGGIEIDGQTYSLELDLFDDASDPSRASTLVQRQVDDGIDFFLGSFGSNIVLPTSAITDGAGRILVQAGGGADNIFTQGRRGVFGIFPRASRQFVSSVQLFQRLEGGPSKVGIIYTNDPFSKSQADGARSEIENAGMEVNHFIELPAEVNDVSTVLNSVRQDAPDILVCTTHDETSMLIARQMVSSGTNVNMLYQTLGPQTSAYREALGDYANSVVTQAYWAPNAAYEGKYFGTAQDFADYFEDNFERELTYHMASGAVCIVAYCEAARQAGSLDTEAVREALAGIDFESFYGRVKFTEDGDGDPELLGPLLVQRQEGEIEVIAPEDAATADPIYPAPDWQERG